MVVTVNGTELFCLRHGSGIPMLTLHGPGFDHTMFRSWLDPLGDEHEVIYFDLRGCGRSRRDAVDAITDATWVADADAVRAALGHEQVIVFGHSYGGCLAQEYALAYPERVRAVILCATAPAFDYLPLALAALRERIPAEAFQDVVTAFGAPAADDDAFREAWLRILPLYFHVFEPALGAALTEHMQYSAAASNRMIFGLLPQFSTLGRMGRLTCPALILDGASDWVTPPEHGGQRLAGGIARATHVTFRRSGHFPFVEEPGRFLQTVRRWLATAG